MRLGVDFDFFLRQTMLTGRQQCRENQTEAERVFQSQNGNSSKVEELSKKFACGSKLVDQRKEGTPAHGRTLKGRQNLEAEAPLKSDDSRSKRARRLAEVGICDVGVEAAGINVQVIEEIENVRLDFKVGVFPQYRDFW